MGGLDVGRHVTVQGYSAETSLCFYCKLNDFALVDISLLKICSKVAALKPPDLLSKHLTSLSSLSEHVIPSEQ